MSTVDDRIRLRIGVISLGVIAMFAILLVRLWFLQVLAGERFSEASERNSVRIISVDAPRGRILDRQGRVLVDNRTALAVGIRKDDLPKDDDEERAVLRRVADLVAISMKDLRARLADPRTSPFKPVIVATDVSEDIIFAIRERRTTDFRGTETLTIPVRRYPRGRIASHILGYVGEISEAELAERPTEYRLGDDIGRTGIERQYENDLRGTPGLQKLEVDATGRVLRVLGERPPTPGKDLQLTIDAKVQRVAEDALREGILRARAARFRETNEPFRAPAGAAVVLDPETGDVIAMASLPTFDVRKFVGGVSADYWAKLNDPDAHNPLLNRAIQTSYPPGSTIKPLFALAALETGVGQIAGRYPCQTEFRFGDTVFRNWQPRNESISIEQSLVESCDTVYYRFSQTWWFQEQNQISAGDDPQEVMQIWSRRFGLGATTGLDLPQEDEGRVPGREWKQQVWELNKDEYCREYRETKSVLFEDLCERGFLWRGGDAVNMSIGQGDLEATPLQMASAYGAIANDGTLMRPRLVRRVMHIDGQTAERFAPEERRTIAADREHLRYVQNSLGEVSSRGTGSYPFRGWPHDRIPVASKTGSAELAGKQPFSWFAAFGPIDRPRYVAAAVVEEAGAGSAVSGPVVRRIMDELFDRTPLPVLYGATRSD